MHAHKVRKNTYILQDFSKNVHFVCVGSEVTMHIRLPLELSMPIWMHICRGRGLWGVLSDVVDVHFDAYLQGSRPMGCSG